MYTFFDMAPLFLASINPYLIRLAVLVSSPLRMLVSEGSNMFRGPDVDFEQIVSAGDIDLTLNVISVKRGSRVDDRLAKFIQK